MRIPCGGESVRLQPQLVGAGLLLGAILEVLQASGIDWTRDDGALALLFNQWTAGTLAILAALWCLGWAVAQTGRAATAGRKIAVALAARAEGTMAQKPAAALAATAVVLLAGCYVTGAPLLNVPLSPVSMAVSGSAFAIGIAACVLLWFRVYAALPAGSALAHGALSVGASGLVRPIMASHDAVTTLLIFTACCLASYACLISLAPESLAEGEGVAEDMPVAGDAECAPGSEGWRPAAKSALPVLWLPLAAACIVGFIQGLVWDPVTSQTNAAGALDLQILELPVGCLGACAGVLLALRFAPTESQSVRIVIGGLPIAMGVLLLYPAVVPGGTLAADLLGWLPQLCFALVLLFTWQSLLLARQTARGCDAPILFFALAPTSIAYWAGLALIHVIGTGGRDLCLVLLTAFLVLFCLFLAQETRTEQQGRTADELRPETFIHRRCDELAAEHGISPRETEVLYYLGRGYNHTYIARKLFVSENTVRTHVRHIYGKLGLSSREELLDLIDRGDV